MYKLDVAPDPREQAKLDAMRRREQERKARFFDPRTRTKGRDVEALAAQVAERQQRERLEVERDEALGAFTTLCLPPPRCTADAQPCARPCRAPDDRSRGGDEPTR